MLGTIIGDLVGSKYENLLFRPKKIKIFDKRNRMTDDSLLTLEVIKVLINNYPILFDQNSLNKIFRCKVNYGRYKLFRGIICTS